MLVNDHTPSRTFCFQSASLFTSCFDPHIKPMRLTRLFGDHSDSNFTSSLFFSVTTGTRKQLCSHRIDAGGEEGVGSPLKSNQNILFSSSSCSWVQKEFFKNFHCLALLMKARQGLPGWQNKLIWKDSTLTPKTYKCCRKYNNFFLKYKAKLQIKKEKQYQAPEIKRTLRAG